MLEYLNESPNFLVSHEEETHHNAKLLGLIKLYNESLNVRFI